ncbi:NAD(P)-binding protein [Exidia glandulosa HHB12029]|uniref:NAD(P)-binding protein n=1 Tax=Exidia glandulosa HHB12029 TaxID=1314781 RepID=A0A165G6R3_EXIGL|nr:NAD(P)-binding protein [Exidia glandulosa HHB12029]
MVKFSAWKFMREQLAALPPVTIVDLSGKTIIVTGGNTGLGFEAAKHFASMKPGRLILACRSKERGEAAVTKLGTETGYRKAEFRHLDLDSFDSTINFVEELEREDARVDVVVANAAVHPSTYKKSSHGWESTLQVNHLSTALLSILLVPLFVKTAQTYSVKPRLVIVSSATHFMYTIPESALKTPKLIETFTSEKFCDEKHMAQDRYNLSKLLNVFLTRSLASHLGPSSPVIVNNVAPGFCISELRREIPASAKRRVAIMEFFLARTTESGSRTLVWAALQGDPDKVRGKYLSSCRVAEESDYVLYGEGPKIEKRLWDETIEILEKVSPKVKDIESQYLSHA